MTKGILDHGELRWQWEFGCQSEDARAIHPTLRLQAGWLQISGIVVVRFNSRKTTQKHDTSLLREEIS
jgi:hypothetical protein